MASSGLVETAALVDVARDERPGRRVGAGRLLARGWHCVCAMAVAAACLCLARARLDPFDASDQVLLARDRLGPSIWTMPVELTLRQSEGPLPENVAALVFEFQGILWLYTPYDGTRSISQYLGCSERDKARLEELLHRALPGLAGVRLSPPPGGPSGPRRDGSLARGCFVDCIAALNQQLGSGVRVVKAALLCVTFTGDGQNGSHTVLFVRTASERFVIDPARSLERVDVPAFAADSAMRLGSMFVPFGRAVSARWLPVIDKGERVSMEPREMARAIAPQT